MQQIFINRKVVGKRKPMPLTSFITMEERVQQKEFYSKKRIIREIVYFKTKAAAEKFRLSVKEPDYCGKIFIDRKITKYALYHYRHY